MHKVNLWVSIFLLSIPSPGLAKRAIPMVFPQNILRRHLRDFEFQAKENLNSFIPSIDKVRDTNDFKLGYYVIGFNPNCKPSKLVPPELRNGFANSYQAYDAGQAHLTRGNLLARKQIEEMFSKLPCPDDSHFTAMAAGSLDGKSIDVWTTDEKDNFVHVTVGRVGDLDEVERQQRIATVRIWLFVGIFLSGMGWYVWRRRRAGDVEGTWNTIVCCILLIVMSFVPGFLGMLLMSLLLAAQFSARTLLELAPFILFVGCVGYFLSPNSRWSKRYPQYRAEILDALWVAMYWNILWFALIFIR